MPRCACKAGWERAAGEGSAATERRRRRTTGLAACNRKRSAQRASASVGDRDRHPKGEDRVSGLRGAGRGEAAPGGIEPGARSLDRAGAPIMPVGQRRNRVVIGHDRQRTMRIQVGMTGKVASSDRDGGRRAPRAFGEGASAPSRTRGRTLAAWGTVAVPGARAAPARSAAPRSATPGTAQKKGPIPRRSEEPALTGRGSAALTR